MRKVWVQWKAWGSIQPAKLGEVRPSLSGATPRVRALIFFSLESTCGSLAGLSVFLCSLHTPSLHRISILAVPYPISRWLQHSCLTVTAGTWERWEVAQASHATQVLCCRQMKTAKLGSVFRVRVTGLVCYSWMLTVLFFGMGICSGQSAASGLNAMRPSVFAWFDQMVFHDSHFSAHLSFYVGLHEVALVGAPVTLACVGLPFASLKSGFICPITTHHQFLFLLIVALTEQFFTFNSSWGVIAALLPSMPTMFCP